MFSSKYKTGDKITINNKTDTITSVIDDDNMTISNINIGDIENYSEDWDFKKEVDVQRIVVFGNNPLKNRITDLILGMFLMVFNNDQVELEKYIDIDSFDISNYDDSKDVPFYYEFYVKVDNTFDFVQDELFKLLNAYPVINNEGKLKLIKQKLPDVGEGTIDVDQNNIMSLNQNVNDFSNLITNINVNYNYDFRKDYFLTDPQNFTSENVTKFGKSPKKPFEYNVRFDKNMTDIDKSTFNQQLANALFERYDDRIKLLSFDLFFSQNVLINEGDYVKIVHPNIVDWQDGANVGLRGLVDIPESIDMLINRGEQWGNFIGSSKDNSIGYLGQYKVIKVDRDVNVKLFNQESKSIANNHWNTKYKIPARFYATKGVLDNQGNYGEIK